MKKKELKQLVRDLDGEVIELENKLSCTETRAQAAVDGLLRRCSQYETSIRRLDAQCGALDAQCKGAALLMQAATQEITQGRALAAHYANVGAYIERAKRVEKDCDAAQDAIMQVREILGARDGETAVEAAKRVSAAGAALREYLARNGKADAEVGAVTYALDTLTDATRVFDQAVPPSLLAKVEPLSDETLAGLQASAR